MSRTVEVDLGERSYPIRIGEGTLPSLGEVCRRAGLGGRCLVITDGNVGPLYVGPALDALAKAGIDAEEATVPAGEASKSGDRLFELDSKALAAGLDRKSFIVALGGGVVGDLAGYAAASFLRGIPFVQVPTSIVAMVDSAVGGKTGINLPEGKNLVGSFHQPSAVLVDLDAVATLPSREYVSGLAEVVKYGIIRDAAFFGEIESSADRVRTGDRGLLEALVSRSCEIKAEVVHEDEREGGLRAILTFGHTLGHAIEKVAGYGAYLHGEAIAIGMVYAARLSVAERGLPPAEAERIARLLEALGLPVRAPGLGWDRLREAMGVDKKSVGRAPRFVLADAVGSVAFGCTVAEERLEETWHVLHE